MILSDKSAIFWDQALREAAAWNLSGNGLRLMANFLERSPAAIGGLLAVATIPLHLLISKTQSEQFAAVLLAAIGAIYVGFGLQTSNRAQIMMELTVALGFFSAALAGHWFTPWVVVMHGIWDYAHH
jgi:hypothetical protein